VLFLSLMLATRHRPSGSGGREATSRHCEGWNSLTRARVTWGRKGRFSRENPSGERRSSLPGNSGALSGVDDVAPDHPRPPRGVADRTPDRQVERVGRDGPERLADRPNLCRIDLSEELHRDVKVCGVDDGEPSFGPCQSRLGRTRPLADRFGQVDCNERPDHTTVLSCLSLQNGDCTTGAYPTEPGYRAAQG